MAVPSSRFKPVDLERQIERLSRLDRQCDSFMAIPSGFPEIGELLCHVKGPIEGCIQTLHIQHFSPEVTNLLVASLVNKQSSLPSPWDWMPSQGVAEYSPGQLYVIDVSFGVENGTTLDDVRSRLVSRNLVKKGKWTRLGGIDTLMAYVLQRSELPELLVELDARSIAFPGVHMHVSSAGRSLVPYLPWDYDEYHQTLGAIWSHSPLKKCLVPMVERVQLVGEPK